MKIQNNYPQMKQPTFGSAASLSEKLLSGGKLRSLSNGMEYKNFNMSSASLYGLFMGAVVLPRYLQAYDKYDRREIIRRDLISLTALSFLARALTKGFSEISRKTTGLVLNQKPENFNKFGTKLWSYINPESEFQALNSGQILSKYSNIHENKNGILDFCEFINSKGGNLNKVLSTDGTIKANTEKLLGKSLKETTYDEIVNTFKKAKDSQELKNIYKVFESPTNKLVRKAKMRNSVFGFIATFVLTPALIIWIAKSNEKMTKRRVAHDLAEKHEHDQQVLFASQQQTKDKAQKA